MTYPNAPFQETPLELMGVAKVPGAVVPAGSLIAANSYGPATQTTYNLNTNYPQVMDAVHLTVGPFTVPLSGQIFVDVTADWGLFATGSLAQATDLFMMLAVHGTNGGTAVCAPQSWGGSATPSITIGGRATHRYFCSGLVPGSSLQLDLCMGLSNAANVTGAFYATQWQNNTVISNNPTGPIETMVFAA